MMYFVTNIKDVSTLDYLKQNGYKIVDNTHRSGALAISFDNIVLLQWLDKHDLYISTTAYVANYTHELEVLKWLHHMYNKMKNTSTVKAYEINVAETIKRAIEHNKVTIIEWLDENGYIENLSNRNIADIERKACMYSSFEISAAISKLGIYDVSIHKTTSGYCSHVASLGRLDLLQEAVKNGYTVHSRYMYNSIAKGGHLAIAKWLYNVVKVTPDLTLRSVCSDAIRNNNLAFLKWANKECRFVIYKNDAFEIVKQTENKRVLEWLKNNTTRSIRQSSSSNNTTQSSDN